MCFGPEFDSPHLHHKQHALRKGRIFLLELTSMERIRIFWNQELGLLSRYNSEQTLFHDMGAMLNDAIIYGNEFFR